MLDKLNPILRHGLLMLVAAALTWAGTDLVPALRDQGGIAALAATLVTMAIAYVTPLTRQYGIGS